MSRPSREEIIDGRDYYFAVKVKHVAEHRHEEVHAEYTYRISSFVSELPSSDDDLGFQGFRMEDVDYPSEARLRSYVCTEMMCITRGGKKHGRLKKQLGKQPWERTAGGV